MKLSWSEMSQLILSKSMYKMYIEIMRAKHVRSDSTSWQEKIIYKAPEAKKFRSFLIDNDERST